MFNLSTLHMLHFPLIHCFLFTCKSDQAHHSYCGRKNRSWLTLSQQCLPPDRICISFLFWLILYFIWPLCWFDLSSWNPFPSFFLMHTLHWNLHTNRQTNKQISNYWLWQIAFPFASHQVRCGLQKPRPVQTCECTNFNLDPQIKTPGHSLGKAKLFAWLALNIEKELERKDFFLNDFESGQTVFIRGLMVVMFVFMFLFLNVECSFLFLME